MSKDYTVNDGDNTMSVQSVEFDELQSANTSDGKSILDGNIDAIKNVKVNVEVAVGDAEMSVDELFNLKEDSVIKLNQNINEPLMLYLDGKLIARGSLVAVDDNFGIQITEISS